MTDIVPAKKQHTCSTTVQRAPASAGDARITISTADEDRYGDVLLPEGALLDAFNRNPVVLFGHDAGSLPVGRAVHLSVQAGTGIQADFVWLKNDPFADRVRNAFEQGVLNAASVGFLPKKWEPHNKKGGLRYTEWELLEFSLVPVPANPNALRTLKHFGLDTPTPVAQANALLDEILRQLRSGLLLSHDNEHRLQQASSVLADVLANIDQTGDADECSEHAVVFNDGPTVQISEETLNAAIRHVVDSEIARATGRVQDEPLLLARHGGEPVIELTEHELADLIERGVREGLNSGFNRLTGRID